MFVHASVWVVTWCGLAGRQIPKSQFCSQNACYCSESFAAKPVTAQHFVHHQNLRLKRVWEPTESFYVWVLFRCMSINVSCGVRNTAVTKLEGKSELRSVEYASNSRTSATVPSHTVFIFTII
jgi:hypothetical protein